MRICVHLNKFYDHQPLPSDVPTTGADFEKALQQGRVKPAHGGGWLMRVTKTMDTHTDVLLPESAIIATIVDEMINGDRKMMNRLEACARHLTRHVMPNHAHKNWMEEFEVHDDGPDEGHLRSELARFVEAGKIEASDVEPIVAAYLTHVDPVTHLHAHFGCTEQSIARSAARRASREAAKAEMVKAHEEAQAAKAADASKGKN